MRSDLTPISENKLPYSSYRWRLAARSSSLALIYHSGEGIFWVSRPGLLIQNMTRHQIKSHATDTNYRCSNATAMPSQCVRIMKGLMWEDIKTREFGNTTRPPFT
jgi:hypothetical protein